MRLEPDEGKLSSPVLRGGSGSNATALPDKFRHSQQAKKNADRLEPKGKWLDSHLHVVATEA